MLRECIHDTYETSNILQTQAYLLLQYVYEKF